MGYNCISNNIKSTTIEPNCLNNNPTALALFPSWSNKWPRQTRTRKYLLHFQPDLGGDIGLIF